MGGIVTLWIWSLLCIPPWYFPLAREELSEKRLSGRQYEVCKPGMFVQDGNGSALTRGNKQAAAAEKKHGFVQRCELASGYLQDWPSWTGKVCRGVTDTKVSLCEWMGWKPSWAKQRLSRWERNSRVNWMKWPRSLCMHPLWLRLSAQLEAAHTQALKNFSHILTEPVRNLAGLSVSIPRCKFDEITQWRRNGDLLSVGGTGAWRCDENWWDFLSWG